MDGRRAATWDVWLYGASAVFAGGAALFAAIPLYREWGRMAAGPYAAGAAVAALLAVRGGGVRARAWLAAAILVGAALIPLSVEAVWRADAGPGLHIQSEAIVTEEAAKALLDGRNPYAASFVHGPLSARPLPTTTHYPYLPGMVVFGLPRALDGRSPLWDARVWFAAVTLGVAWLALRWWRGPPEPKVRAAQVLLVLPTGALLMATGGDDLPVLALLLLSFVVFDADRDARGGVAGGLAGALKQSAWPALPFLGVAAFRRDGRRGVVRLVGAWLAAALPLIIAFALWDPPAFLEDAVRFPLGLGRGASAAGTPTPGSALIHAFPKASVPLTLVFGAVVLGVALFLLIRRPPGSAAEAAGACGLTLAVALVLAPAARFGYVVYPVNLLAWGWLLSRNPGRSSVTAPSNTWTGSSSEAGSSSRT